MNPCSCELRKSWVIISGKTINLRWRSHNRDYFWVSNDASRKACHFNMLLQSSDGTQLTKRNSQTVPEVYSNLLANINESLGFYQNSKSYILLVNVVQFCDFLYLTFALYLQISADLCMLYSIFQNSLLHIAVSLMRCIPWGALPEIHTLRFIP
jgi:hypothetical protein